MILILAFLVALVLTDFITGMVAGRCLVPGLKCAACRRASS